MDEPEERVRKKPAEGGAVFLERAAKAFQANIIRSGPAAAASYGLIGAILLFGGIGYALDRWLGASWYILAGLLLGLVVGFYGLAKAVWKK